jgi:hypothetical protein
MSLSTNGKLVVAALAGLFATAPLAARAAGDKDAKKDAPKIHCEGINKCAGHGACHSANNACAGKNGCAGKGWVEVDSEKECKDKGGKVVAADPPKK